MKQFKAVSLFSNCGAGDVGYRDAGFKFEVMAELVPHRMEVSLLNHPGAVGIVGDIRETWSQVVSKYRERAGNERPSLLCACPPCQGMSSARSGIGKHEDADAGSKDERNLLVTSITKVAKELQPDIIVVENVPAFFSRKVRHPRDKKPVSAANLLISSLYRDYIAFPLICDLSDYGVPQYRNRAFLTFIRKDLEGIDKLISIGRAPFPRPTHTSEFGGPSPITLSEALKSFQLPELDASNKELAEANAYEGFHSVPVWNERIYSMVNAIPKASGRSAWQNNVCLSCGTEDFNEKSVLCSVCSSPLPKPLVQEKDGNYRLVRGFGTSYRRMHADRPSATITTASGHIGSDYTIHPTENRVLSIIECALLQTFPQNFEWGDTLKKYGSMNVREMIGEAVPPLFTKLHGDVLMGVLSEDFKQAPISVVDERSINGWKRLIKAAEKDKRKDPRKYFRYTKYII